VSTTIALAERPDTMVKDAEIAGVREKMPVLKAVRAMCRAVTRLGAHNETRAVGAWSAGDSVGR
jgi:hypothetical protein